MWLNLFSVLVCLNILLMLIWSLNVYNIWHNMFCGGYLSIIPKNNNKKKNNNNTSLMTIWIWNSVFSLDELHSSYSNTVKAAMRNHCEEETDLQQYHFNSNMALHFYIFVPVMKDHLSYQMWSFGWSLVTGFTVYEVGENIVIYISWTGCFHFKQQPVLPYFSNVITYKGWYNKNWPRWH